MCFGQATVGVASTKNCTSNPYGRPATNQRALRDQFEVTLDGTPGAPHSACLTLALASLLCPSLLTHTLPLPLSLCIIRVVVMISKENKKSRFVLMLILALPRSGCHWKMIGRLILLPLRLSLFTLTLVLSLSLYIIFVVMMRSQVIKLQD